MKRRRWVAAFGCVAFLHGTNAANAQTLQRYWGDFQGDNRVGPSEVNYFVHGRDVGNLDFVALTPHALNLAAAKWTRVKAAAAQINAPGSFVAFSGFEWNSDTWGHKSVYFLTDDQPLIPPNALDSNHPAEFFALMRQTNGIGHAAHPSLATVSTNWDHHDVDVQLGVEVYSRWGSFETSTTAGKSVRDAWARGYRLAVMATSDTDSVPGVEGGLTAVLAPELSRQAIIDAIRARRTYATTGARIGLDFTIGSNRMGDIVNDLVGVAQIRAQVDGTGPLARVEVRRSNELAYTYTPAPARVFVDAGAPLAYFPGTQEPPPSWKSAGFSGSGWLPGRSGIGFADDDDVTVITGMKNNYLSLYTRQTFSITDFTPQKLYLGVDYDDGFAAYLDGVEVVRANMPNTALAYNTQALSFREPNLGAMAVVGATQAPFYTVDGTPAGTPVNPTLDLFDISAFAYLLTPGVHVLAIQVHNSFLTSNDLTLIPRLYEPNTATQTTVQFTDAGATGDRFYDVKVVQLDGETAWSTPIWLNPDAPPRPITTVLDHPNDNGSRLDIAWTKSVAPDFGYYNIFVSEFDFTDAAGMTPWNPNPIYNGDSLMATIDSLAGASLERGQTYYVYVAAFDWAGKMNTTTFGAIGSGAPIDNLAPQAPLFATASDTPNDDGGSLTIAWGASADDGAGAGDVQRYEIFRRSSSGSYGSTPLATRSAGTLGFLDNTPSNTTQYFYRVRAHDGVNASGFSPEFGPVQSVDNGGLSEPRSVTASDVAGDQGGRIRLTWTASPDATIITQYNVFRAFLPGVYSSPIGEVPNTVTSFVDSAATVGTAFYYVVVSDSAGVRQSSWSNEVGPVQSLDNVAPERVTLVDALDNTLGGSVNVNWTYDEVLNSDVDHYDIYYKTSSFTSVSSLSPIATATRGSTLAVIAGLLNNDDYWFAVVAVDAVGNFRSTGLTTNAATPTDRTKPVFAGLQSLAAGDASLTLGWSPAQDNTLPITYSLYMRTTPGAFNYSSPMATVPGANPIIALGSGWRYFKGLTAPPPAWKQKIYDDSGWLLGEGAFGYDLASTPIYKLATVLSDMPNSYASVFFRHTFELAAVPNNLVLGILTDDGYIAYVNGVEVARYNLDDPVNHTSLAEKGINAPWSGSLDLASPTNYNPNPVVQQVDISAYAGVLSVGTNVLAVQVHNRKKDNPDFLFLATLSTANTRHTVAGLDESQMYYFTMRAKDGANNVETNTIVVSGQPIAAPPPAAVSSLSLVKSAGALALSWSPVSTDSAGGLLNPEHYNVYRGTTPNFVADLDNHTNLLASSPGTSYVDYTGLGVGTDLYYRVTAVSASGRESRLLSPLGLKTRRALTFTSGAANRHWIAIPYVTGMPDAQTLLLDLNGGPFPGPVTRIERFNASTQARQVLFYDDAAWVGENFPLTSGEAYIITLQADLVLTQVGAHNPNLGFTYSHNVALSSFYMLGLPYHHDYIDAMSLLNDLNAGNPAPAVTKVLRLDPATGAFDSFLHYEGQWFGSNFALTPGQGYAVIVGSNINGWKPRTR